MASVILGDTAWRDRVLAAVRCLLHPSEFITEPPPDTSLADLEAVRTLIDPDPTGSEQAANLLLAQQLGMRTPDIDPAGTSARAFSGRCCGHSKVEERVDLFRSFLELVDVAIEGRLTHASTQQLICTADFGRDGLSTLFEQAIRVGSVFEGCWFCIGLIEHLPANHPLRSWPADRMFEHTIDGVRVPSVVLGPQLPGQGLLGPQQQNRWSNPGKPRAFYSLSIVERWTALFRSRQEQVDLEKPAFALSERDIARLKNMEQQRGKPLPKPGPLPPIPWPLPPPTWRQRMELAIEAHYWPGHLFQPPPEGTSLQDLLTVRQAMAVNEDQDLPVLRASQEMAHRVAGDSRRDDLHDLLRPVIVALDKAVRDARDQGIHWSAIQCRLAPQDGHAELVKLRGEVSELKGRLDRLEAARTKRG